MLITSSGCCNFRLKFGTLALWLRVYSLDMVEWICTPPHAGIFQGLNTSETRPSSLSLPYSFSLDLPDRRRRERQLDNERAQQTGVSVYSAECQPLMLVIPSVGLRFFFLLLSLNIYAMFSLYVNHQLAPPDNHYSSPPSIISMTCLMPLKGEHLMET